MLYIFDFDNTLFNTSEFAERLIKELTNITNNEEFVRKEFNNLKLLFPYNYSLKKHIASLRLDQNILNDKKLTFLSDLSEFVNPGAKQILNNLKSKKHTIYLLTRGDEEFQKIKILGAGLTNFFDKIIITPSSKEKILQKIIKDKTGIFVNDNYHENCTLEPLFPNLEFILFVRQNANQFYNLAEVKTRKIHSLQDLYTTGG